MCEEVCRAVDRGFLIVREVSEKCRGVGLEVRRVVAVYEDWVCEPAFVEVPSTLNSDCVVGRIGQGDFVATVGLETDGAVETHGLSQAVGFAVSKEDRLPAVERLLFRVDGSRFEETSRERIGVAEHNRLVHGIPRHRKLPYNSATFELGVSTSIGRDFHIFQRPRVHIPQNRPQYPR